MCFMQEIMYYLLFFHVKKSLPGSDLRRLFIPKRRSGQLLHACILEMLIRLIDYIIQQIFTSSLLFYLCDFAIYTI